MDNYKDFTFDPVRFPVDQVNAFMNELHNNHQHYVLMTGKLFPAFPADSQTRELPYSLDIILMMLAWKWEFSLEIAVEVLLLVKYGLDLSISQTFRTLLPLNIGIK